MSVWVWFREDLRVHDHPALTQALATGRPVNALYVKDERAWSQHDLAPQRIQFHLKCLEELRTRLHRLGISLWVESIGDQSLEAWWQAFVLQHQIEHLFFHHEYEINEQQRDARVTTTLTAQGGRVTALHDECIVPPGSILTRQGTPYTVFTPFKRAWCEWMATHPLSLWPVPPSLSPPGSSAEPLQPLAETSEFWITPGEHAAHLQLQHFLKQAVTAYHERRDRMDVPGTSMLSPYLTAGAISARTCAHAVWQLNQQQWHQGSPGLVTWINELIWRDFYKHVLFHFPHVSKSRSFRREWDDFPWRHDTEAFERWCQGKTGYPIVDAAMRQLLHTGWMHNRARMIVASFLTKHLLIDWRWGERWFMQHLLDGDLAANNGGWQWSAGCGTDAQPYFRIFNPMNQSRQFDPDTAYLLKYCPELNELALEDRHAPWEAGPMVAALCDYPEPIVEHARARERALKTYADFKSSSAG